MSASVVVRDAHKRFGERAALAGVSLDAAQGVTTILGPNGAGKTSLLRALATVQDIDGGQITIDGLDAANRHQRIEIRRRLGYLPQDIDFSRRATAFDVVDYLTVLKGWRDARARRREVWLALDRVGLATRAADRVGTLSGGLRRRLGLAQAIVGTPPLIVLDEPSAGFDPAQRLELRTLLSELARRSTVIVSTHQTDDAAVCSDVVFVLGDGEVRFRGTPGQLAALARGRTWRASTTTGHERAWWRLPSGEFRCIGDPPPGAVIDEPTVEDGYLVLEGENGPRTAPGQAGS
jgi:ABC-2 type transport system ATP-binding protein